MTDPYNILYRGGEGELVEKKSRFIATTRPVESEEEALAFIEEMKKKYWDARHNCFAYVTGDRGSCRDAAMTGSRARRRAGLCWMSFLERESVISAW
ncbi:YigZ family protein [Clostridium sp. AN503]|uniref:YigZ family protein n=1 Tax=Clostridium sp. AN503 TaxID=3160598 RepID=UPI0034589ECE